MMVMCMLMTLTMAVRMLWLCKSDAKHLEIWAMQRAAPRELIPSVVAVLTGTITSAIAITITVTIITSTIGTTSTPHQSYWW